MEVVHFHTSPGDIDSILVYCRTDLIGQIIKVNKWYFAPRERLFDAEVLSFIARKINDLNLKKEG